MFSACMHWSVPLMQHFPVPFTNNPSIDIAAALLPNHTSSEPFQVLHASSLKEEHDIQQMPCTCYIFAGRVQFCTPYT